MTTTRLAFISFAHGHAGIYCRALADRDDVELVSCWDDDTERGQRNAEEFGIHFHTDIDALLTDASIDTVLINSETNRHAGFVERPASAGKNVLLQKSMATSLADCDRIIAAVKESGIRFSMAYQMRHDPANNKIRELLAENAVGKVAMMRRRHSISVLLNPDFVNGPSRWHFDPQANIGMFFDDASHPADWLYSLFGMPVSVSAEIDAIISDVAPDDNGVAIFRFARGEMVVLLNSSTTLAAVSTTEVYGDQGTIVHDYGDDPSTSAPRDPHAVPLRLLRKGAEQWEEFPIAIPASHAERIGPFHWLLSNICAATKAVPSAPSRAALRSRWCWGLISRRVKDGACCSPYKGNRAPSVARDCLYQCFSSMMVLPLGSTRNVKRPAPPLPG
ncbi:MAG: Gfo/Idh/MocA family protein [Candidatus Latescibacterota bacterium]|jgi:predicted dehydrogenase